MKMGRIYRVMLIAILLASAAGLGGGSAQALDPEDGRLGGFPPAAVIRDEALLQGSGPVKIVVELSDAPAVQSYAENGGGISRAAVSQARLQLSRIETAQAAFTQSVRTAGVAMEEIYRTQRVFNGIAMQVDSQDVKAIAALPGVRAVYPLTSKELDNSSSVSLTGALEAWASKVNPLDPASADLQGQGVDIGIIDTGIDYTHLNFGGAGTPAAYTGNDPVVIEPGSFPTAKVVGGYDFAGNSYDAYGLYGYITPSPDPDPLDCNGHGSHVAGTAAGLGILQASTSNPAPAAYASYASLAPEAYRSLFRIGPGVAPRANLYALKIFGCGGASDLTDEAIEWAVDPNQDGDLSDHLDVINLSLGSAFGVENDTSAIAANNAALAGILVVASAGNNGDVYYISGSPGVAQRAISVAGSQDGSLSADGFNVLQTPDAGILPAGVYGSVNSSAYYWLGPTSGVTGDVRYLGANASSGCTAFPAGSFTSQVALLDWTSLPDGSSECPSSTRVANARAAGAIGVIFVYDKTPLDMAITGSSLIPATITTQATGANLKTAMAANPAVRLRVNLSAAYNGTQLEPYDTSLDNQLYGQGSRGPRRADSGLKPDLAAPAVTVFSTYARSGSQGTNLSGTSMASPHVAGAMALLRQKYGSWSVEELKALAMNTATVDVIYDPVLGVASAPDRVGAGRVNLAQAVRSNLIAYSIDEPGTVSISFGLNEVIETSGGTDLTTNRHFIIANKGLSSVSFNVSLENRYPTNPGVHYVLLNGAVPVSNPLILPAGGNLSLTLRQTINASLLQRVQDPASAQTVTVDGVEYPREFLSQSGGYVLITPLVSQPTLRLPFYGVHRPAGQRAAAGGLILGAEDEGGLVLPMTGPVMSSPDDTPRVQVLELLHENPDDSWSTGTNNNADLMAVGASSNSSAAAAPGSIADVTVTLGVATFGRWSTPLEVEFQVYIDTNEDSFPEWVLFNAGTGMFTGAQNDLFLSILCPYPIPSASEAADACVISGTVNHDTAGGVKINSNPFNSNGMALAATAGQLGLSPGNTDFLFFVDTYNRSDAGLIDTTPWLHYDIQKQAFDTVDPASQTTLWADQGNISLRYDKTDLFYQGGSLGLLLLHHHNTGNQAEIVRLNPTYAALTWDKYNALVVRPGNRVTIPLRVVNETNGRCSFDLSAVQDPETWPFTFALNVVEVPANGSYGINTTVTVPAGALAGTVKQINLTATCRQNPAVVATNHLTLVTAYPIFMPLVTR